MTLSLYRRESAFMRLISVVVALAFTLSLAGTGFAAPPVSDPASEDAVVASEVSKPDVDVADEKKADEVEEPKPDPSVEAAPVTTEPDPEPAGDQDESEKGKGGPKDKAPEEPELKDEEPAELEEPVVEELMVEEIEAEEIEAEKLDEIVALALVDPVLVGGNPSLGAGGLRVSGAGTYYHTFMGEEITITVTVQETVNGQEFSFVSSSPVIKVVAKGGTGGANIYSYSPGVLSDSGLHTPVNPSGKWADISHLDFYFAPPEEPEDVEKTFELTYAGAPVGAEFFAVYSLAGEAEVSVPLLPVGGVFVGSVELPYGSVIDSVTWKAELGGIEYTLGTELDLGEVLNEDLVNRFSYGASVSGHKFGDLNGNGEWDEGEVGLAGWTIGLYRATPEPVQISALPAALLGFELVAQTVTGAGGVYSFSGLLPGEYYVAEEDRIGWIMTVGPLGTFMVSNGSALADLDFGNTEEILPFTAFEFDKSADMTVVEPGDIVTYTLTYRLVEGSAPWTDPIPVIDDFDERYMTPLDVNGGVVAGGKITWIDNADLATGETRTIVYTMQVNDPLPEGVTTIDNLALLDVQGGYEDDWTVEVDEFLPFTDDVKDEEPFLPFTGGEWVVLALAVLTAGALGLSLRRLSRGIVS